MGLHLQFIPGPAAYFQGLVLYLSLLKVSFDWGSGLQAESLSKDSLHLRGNLLLVFFGFLHLLIKSLAYSAPSSFSCELVC